MRLVRGIADRFQEHAPPEWLWKGREVLLVDGSTVSMPDSKANQRAFPQTKTQAPGVGFALARIVAVVSLAKRAARDLAIGSDKGEKAGENTRFRTLWDNLEKSQFVLGDRYFESYFGIAFLVARGVDELFWMHQPAGTTFAAAPVWASRTMSYSGPNRSVPSGWIKISTINSPSDCRCVNSACV